MTANALPSPSRLGASRLDSGRFGDWTGTAAAGAIAAALALIAIVAGWRGSDLPAQLFRVELFRRDGFVFWDSQWFSGHSTLNYSVLSPVLGAITGAVALGAICGVVSAALFDRLVRHQFGVAATVASVWFAVSTVTNLVVGRVTFALGLTFALGALLALQRRWVKIAWLCALCCALASPVAGLFLAVATGAFGLASRPMRTASWVTTAMAIAPVLLIAVAFPSPGMQPYEWWALGCDLALCALFFIVAPPKYPALRYAAVLYAIVLIATKLTSNPLGGNVSRLNQYVAGPLLACLLWEKRRALFVLLAIPLLFWQWFPTFDTIAFAGSDPSTHSAYYQPLLGYFAANPPGFGRVEIPDTYRHWETAFVAPQVALARGWERQLDYAYDAQFYNRTLTPASYRTWLAANGVRYVRVARRPARRLVVHRGRHPEARPAVPEAGVAERALEGVALHRLPRARRRARAPRIAQGRRIPAPGDRKRHGDGAHSRLAALGGRRRRRLHDREPRRVDRDPRRAARRIEGRAGSARNAAVISTSRDLDKWAVRYAGARGEGS